MPILIERKARILGNTQGYGTTPAKRGGAVQGIGGVGTYGAEMLGAARPESPGCPARDLAPPQPPRPAAPAAAHPLGA